MAKIRVDNQNIFFGQWNEVFLQYTEEKEAFVADHESQEDFKQPSGVDDRPWEPAMKKNKKY